MHRGYTAGRRSGEKTYFREQRGTIDTLNHNTKSGGIGSSKAFELDLETGQKQWFRACG